MGALDKPYLKLTEACQTKARSKNSTGMIGNTSTRGSNGAYASGNFASKKAIIECLFNKVKVLKPMIFCYPVSLYFGLLIPSPKVKRRPLTSCELRLSSLIIHPKMDVRR